MQTAQSHPLLTAAEFMQLRGWTHLDLQRAKTSGKVFCIMHTGVEYVPAFLADPSLLKYGIERVCRLLQDLPAGSKWQFLTTPKGSLDAHTPLQCIAKGQIRSVMRTARGFLER